ncbi:MAG TPA: sulfite exporter TauE/SafE family protein, partial [Cyanobacteria bacterium UBA11049]|nr:sulfite exporter TauE/SafE family protein [Cyanobacteria bacterium UBA11049]
MGLVTGWIGLQTATPLVALIGTAISSSILATQWRQVDIKAALPLIVSTLIGIPVGLVLLKFAPEQVARAMLGVILVGYGAYGLLGLQLPAITTDQFASLFGFIAGVLGGAYNTNGPPIVV